MSQPTARQLSEFIKFLRGYEYYPKMKCWAFYDELKDKFRYYSEEKLITMFTEKKNKLPVRKQK